MNASPSVPPSAPSAVHVGGSDLVTLSHALTAAGRLHEATLAQWAADLHLVGPHLGPRAAELIDVLESLAPLDPQAALASARAAVASLVDEDVPVLSMLGPTWHLASHGRTTDSPRDAAATSDAALPEHVERALEATMEDSATRAGDARMVSVRLRRSLLRHRAARHRPEEATALARGVLERHEHPGFDRALSEITT